MDNIEDLSDLDTLLGLRWWVQSNQSLQWDQVVNDIGLVRLGWAAGGLNGGEAQAVADKHNKKIDRPRPAEIDVMRDLYFCTWGSPFEQYPHHIKAIRLYLSDIREWLRSTNGEWAAMSREQYLRRYGEWVQANAEWESERSGREGGWL